MRITTLPRSICRNLRKIFCKFHTCSADDQVTSIHAEKFEQASIGLGGRTCPLPAYVNCQHGRGAKQQSLHPDSRGTSHTLISPETVEEMLSRSTCQLSDRASPSSQSVSSTSTSGLFDQHETAAFTPTPTLLTASHDPSIPLDTHPITTLKPALSLRHASRLPQSQPAYLLPCEQPRSIAQTMLKRQATLKMLEGEVPMQVGAETRRYGSTKREKREIREMEVRRVRKGRAREMLRERRGGEVVWG